MQGNLFKEKYLITRVIAYKDPQAYAELYDLYVPSIYRFIFFKVSSVEEAEDITSDTFLKTWEYIRKEESRNIENFKALLYRIARNLVIDFYRKRSLTETYESDDMEKIPDLKESDLGQKLQIKIEITEMEEGLRKLKDEYREVVILRFVEGFSVKEIAKILEKPKGNVRVLTHRALKALKEVMQNG